MSERDRLAGAGGFERAARGLLLVLGLPLLAYGIVAFAVPRARWLDSTPAAGAQLERAPEAVIVRFDRPLHGSSYALLWRLEPRPGRVAARDSLDRGDPESRTLAVAPAESLASGRYEVRWHARTPELYWLPMGSQGYLELVVGDNPIPMRPARQWAEGSLSGTPGRDSRAVLVLAGVILGVLSRLPGSRRAPRG